jgi:hypothetical protein
LVSALVSARETLRSHSTGGLALLLGLRDGWKASGVFESASGVAGFSFSFGFRHLFSFRCFFFSMRPSFRYILRMVLAVEYLRLKALAA